MITYLVVLATGIFIGSLFPHFGPERQALRFVPVPIRKRQR
jgi:hypothetical protein